MMFAFEWQKGGPWDSRGILGSRRFIEDVWKLGTADYRPGQIGTEATAALRRRVHQTITKVGDDLAEFKWNTAVAALMSLRNDLQDARRRTDIAPEVWAEAVDTLLLLLAPIAPHITDELWRQRGRDRSIHLESWPVSDPDVAREETVTMVVQVNGKVRDRIDVPASVSEEEAVELALASVRVRELLDGSEPRQVVARPPKIVNVVV
jgi:leucyl-tRNA synthetase